MTSLINLLRWDEERFGLEYDLDIYMIVAVDFSTWARWRIKVSNIFNSKYVLENALTPLPIKTTLISNASSLMSISITDCNRVTCRDWFQLSLKEGLTVSAIRSSARSGLTCGKPYNKRPALCAGLHLRKMLYQWRTQIRPDKVIEMNNFYP